MSLSIKLHNWNILVTPTVLGRQNDQNCQTVTVTGNIPTGWDWYLLLGLGDQYNAYLMSHENESLTVVLDETALTQSGPYQVQLKAIQLEDPSIIQHTNSTTVLVERTVTGDASWSKSIGEFSQIEARIQMQAAEITQQSSAVSSLVQQAESLALQCQEAAASTQHSAEQAQSNLETISQQANSCQAALSQVEVHTTQAVTAKEQAETASAAAQAAATAARENQESATSACTQAQEYLAETQAARNETIQCAQDFQAHLDQIYTKQECDNQFARPLVADTEIKAAQEIYPDPGSNIIVTAYGYTTQEGSGEPSPNNIRPISVVGASGTVPITLNGTSSTQYELPLHDPLCQGDYVISQQDGSCVEVHRSACITLSSRIMQIYAGVTLVIDWNRAPKVVTGTHSFLCSHFPSSFFGANPANIVILKTNWSNYFDSPEEFIQYCDQQLEAGTPVTLVYPRYTSAYDDGYPNIAFQNTYNHQPVELIAMPDSSGMVTVSGECTIAIRYHQSITKAINDLKAALIMLGL